MTRLWRGAGAFTLTEIALAVGIIAFGLVAVLGIFPVGLGAMRNGRDELAAAHCLRNLSDGIRRAERMPGVMPATYRGGGILTNLTWTVGSADTVTLTLTNLTPAGTPAARVEDALLSAHIAVKAPASTRSAGSAHVTVAWPAQAARDGQTWTRQQGEVATHVVFLPQ